MTPLKLAAQGRGERLGTKIYLLWGGLSLGVAFLATPAKFLAPSLSLPVALDIGRRTFGIYNDVEWALFVLLLILGVRSKAPRRWCLGALVPGAVILAQRFWLIPALDLRTVAIQAGQSSLPSSNLHAVYIAAEALKVLWLLTMGFGDIVSASRPTAPPPAARRGARSTIQAQWKS